MKDDAKNTEGLKKIQQITDAIFFLPEEKQPEAYNFVLGYLAEEIAEIPQARIDEAIAKVKAEYKTT